MFNLMNIADECYFLLVEIKLVNWIIAANDYSLFDMRVDVIFEV